MNPILQLLSKIFKGKKERKLIPLHLDDIIIAYDDVDLFLFTKDHKKARDK